MDLSESVRGEPEAGALVLGGADEGVDIFNMKSDPTGFVSFGFVGGRALGTHTCSGVSKAVCAKVTGLAHGLAVSGLDAQGEAVAQVSDR
jgi:hypothetical protein